MPGLADCSDFIISIPVADRPSHLRNCLESIHRQRVLYGYEGDIRVLVAEDSRDPAHIEAHRRLVTEHCAQGLACIHFDLPEQYRLLQGIPAEQRQQVSRLLTDQPAERFYRKGQAANRNLSYLKMLELTRDRGRTLYYLVDSDQVFLPGLDYFHPIDQVFRTRDVLMLTGKLVGDPPVSPAVMAANFLDDVAAFLHAMAGLDPQARCSFHRDLPPPGDVAYHDLAPLFGFDPPTQPVEYRCPLAGDHDHAACLATFAGRLRGFFFGEHLTRRTALRPGGAALDLAQARTIYPGNYIANFAGLKYIIPFGHLRLRMSGPTAGRLIQAEIGPRFASVNLPMGHERTTEEADGFRPGVERQGDADIDISDELERQFAGDLMLFTVVEWLKDHDLTELASGYGVQEALDRVEAEILGWYRLKHQAVNRRLMELDTWVRSQQGRLAAPAIAQIAQFLGNMERNFGDEAPAWRQIESASHRQVRKGQILDALVHYPGERSAWDLLVSR